MKSTRLSKIERQIAALEAGANPGYMSDPFDVETEMLTLRARMAERDRLIGKRTKPQTLEDVLSRALPVVRACAAVNKATKRKQWNKVRELSADAMRAAHAAHEGNQHNDRQQETAL